MMIKIETKRGIFSLVFLGDGHLLSGGNESGLIRQWNIEDGTEIGEGMKVNLARVLALAVSRDGKWIIGGGDCGYSVWEREDTRQPHHFNDMKDEGSASSVYVVDISPDSTKLATGAAHNVSIWDISTGHRILGPLQHEEGLVAVKFSPDGSRLATSAFGNPLRIYELYNDDQNAQLLTTIADVKLQTLGPISWTGNGENIYVVSEGRHVKTIDVSQWSVTQVGTMPGSEYEERSFSCIALSSNGKFIAASYSKTISFWDTAQHREIGHRLEHNGGRLQSFALSMDNKHLAIGDGAGQIVIHDLDSIIPKQYLERVEDSYQPNVDSHQTMSKEDKIEIRAEKPVYSLVFLDRGNLLSAGNGMEMLLQWNIENGTYVRDGLKANSARIMALAVSRDRELIVGGGSSGYMVWKRQNTLQPPIINPMNGDATTLFHVVDVSPDSTKLATGTDRDVSIWDILTGDRLVGPLDHEQGIVAVKFSPDGNRLATGSVGNTLRIYDLSSNGRDAHLLKEITEIRLQPLAPITWLPNGRTIYVVSADGHVNYIDVSEWSVIRLGIVDIPWTEQERCFSSIALSNNGRFIAALYYKTVAFWDTITHKQIGHHIWHTGARLLSIALSLDNKHLAFSDEAARIYIYNLDGIIPQYYLGGADDSIIHEMEKNEAELEAQMQSLRRQLTKKTSELDRLQTENKDLEQQNKSLRDEYQEKSDRLQKDNANLKKQIDSFRGELESHRLQLNHTLKDNDDLKLRLVSLKDDLSAERSHSDELKKQIAQLKSRLQTLPILVSRGWVRSLLFLQDGSLLSGSEEGIRRWCVDNRTEIGEGLRKNSTVQAVAASGDGKWLVSGERTGATVWDRKTHQFLLTVNPHSTWVTTVDVSPDGTKFATGSSDKKVFIFSINSLTPLVGPVEHGNYVVAVRFSPDGSRIATATWQSDSLRIYELSESNVQLIHNVKVSVNSFPSTCVAWTSDSRRIFVLSSNVLREIEANTGTFLREWTTPGTTTNVYGSIALSTNDKFLACFTGRFVSLWDVVAGTQIGAPWEHAVVVRSIALSSDQKYLAIGDENGQVTMRNLDNIISDASVQ